MFRTIAFKELCKLFISSIIDDIFSVFRFSKLRHNVPALGEVANYGTNYFLLKIKFLAKCKREFTTKFAILPNACYQ